MNYKFTSILFNLLQQPPKIDYILLKHQPSKDKVQLFSRISIL